MNAADPSLPDVVEGLTEWAERQAEYTHLLSQHRSNGDRPRFATCPEDPCVTWRRYISLFTRWQAGRLP